MRKHVSNGKPIGVGPEAARYLKAPNSDLPDRLFDGVFCFFTPSSNRYGDGIQWTLELIFISQLPGLL